MADFCQTGVVTTLHRLKTNSIERLELDLERFARNRPNGLVLPALYSEFETPPCRQSFPSCGRSSISSVRLYLRAPQSKPEDEERPLWTHL
jgi:hypothetical protein